MTISEQIIRAKADYDEVYDAGKAAEREEWWTKFQDNGDATNYTYAFWGFKWTDDLYHPVRGFKVLGGNQMFCQTKITDTKVPIDITASTSNHTYLFNWSTAIVTINKLIVAAHNSYAGDFSGCSNLENITFEGEIGNNIDFSACTKLTHDSLMSIINHLATVSTTKTLTLGTTNLAKLTDAEKAIATGKGWTLA